MLETLVRAIALSSLPEGGWLSREQQEGVRIAASLQIERKRDRWAIPCGEETYRYSGGTCSCDSQVECEHIHAVEYTRQLAEELKRRLCLDEKFSEMEQLHRWVESYCDLVLTLSSYVPPEPGLLTGVKLEAIGDDSFYRNRKVVRDFRAARPWVARILGPSVKFEFEREFLKPSKDYRFANSSGSRGVYWFYQVPEGFIEVQELLAYTKSRRYFARVENLTVKEITKLELLTCLASKSVQS